jgi:hypothetical protein
MYKQLLSPEELKCLRSGKIVETKPQNNDWLFLFKVIVMIGVFYLSFLISVEVFGEPSRRLCNMAFVLYHSACVLAGCAMGILMDILSSNREVNLVEDAVNYNQLQFFVSCNLLTGLFNITMKTYYQGVFISHAVMFLYFFIAVFVFSYCRKCKCCKNLVPS